MGRLYFSMMFLLIRLRAAQESIIAVNLREICSVLMVTGSKNDLLLSREKCSIFTL